MATATKRKFISGVSVICAVMLVVGIFPIVTDSRKAEATDTGEYYYAPAKLYDYYYDTDNGKSFSYTKDHEIYDPNQMINGQKNGDVYKGGNRWRTQLQVPYEQFNREISKYYEDNAIPSNKHALYFGNFYGTNETNSDNERHRTYKTGHDGYYWYSDVYNNFYLNSNNAPSVNDGRVAVTGLVDNTLSGGTSNGTVTQNGVALPQFNDEFISNSKYADVFAIENGFPFNVNRDNSSGLVTYSYDSLEDGNRYYKASNSNPKSGTIEVQKAENGHGRSSKNFVTVGRMEANNETGFYPFNANQSIDSTYNGRENVDYGFGMRLDIPFNLTADGTVTGKDGTKKDIIFNFSGDDDIWIFIDGKMVLDMGGDHGRVTGHVNFNRSKDSSAVYVDHVTASFTDKRRTRAGSQSSYTSSLSSRFNDYTADGTYDIYKTHVMTVFYMERGMFESNLRINFNFQPIKNTLKVVEKTLFDKVNAGLLADTTKVAEKDVFRYHIQNQGTPQSGVTGSDFLYPSTNQKIIRNNTLDIGTEKRSDIDKLAVLNKGDTTVAPAENKFYLDTSQMLPGGGSSTYWDDNAKLIAYVYGNGQNEFINMDRVSGKDHLYSIDLTGKSYTNVIFLRCDTSADASQGSGVWSKVKDNGKNRTPADGQGGWSLSGDSNTVKITGWSNSAVWGDSHSSSGSGTNSNFTPSDPQYFNNVANVTYQLTDPYATYENGNTLSEDDNPFTKNTDGSGNVDLMYGESAYFDGQFRENTKMRVTQNNTLYEPDYTGDEVSFGAGTRSTSDYYYTTVEVVNGKNEVLASANKDEFAGFNVTGEYDYKNNDKSAPVSVTETYINRIQVGSLKLNKVLDPSESVGHTFNFQLKLTQIFGKEGVNASDYAGITTEGASLNADGTFTLGTGESLVIKGIPVHTRYEIIELDNDTFIAKNGSSVISGIIVANSDDNSVLDANNGTTTNTRREGILTLSKEVKAEDPSEILEYEELYKAYNFQVTLTMPNGVDFNNYKSAVGGNWTTSDSGITWQATFPVSMGDDVQLKHIPYGTKYTITEDFSDKAWIKSGEVSNVELDIYNSDPTVTITNTKKMIEKTQYEVHKIWENYTMQDGDSIVLELKGNGVKVGECTVSWSSTIGDADIISFNNCDVWAYSTDENNWSVFFDNLPKFDSNDALIQYTVTEVAVNGVTDDDPSDDSIGRFTVSTVYDSSSEETITNTYKKVPLTMPESGGTGKEDYSFYYVLFGTGAVMLSAWAFFLIIKRRRRNF